MTQAGYAQSPRLDSLRKVLSSATDAKSRVLALNDLAFAIRNTKKDSSRLLAMEALDLSKGLHFYSGMGTACYTVGSFYYQKNNDSALHYFKLSAVYYSYIEESLLRIARAYNGIINTYLRFANYDSAIQVGRRALAVIKASPETGRVKEERLMYLHGTMGTTYYYASDYDSSAHYYLKAIEAGEKMENHEMLGVYYMGLANVHTAGDEFNKAVVLGQKSAAASQKAKDTASLVLTYANLGGYYDKLDSFATARRYIDSSLMLAHAFDSSLVNDDCFRILGNIELHFKNYRKALAYYKQGLSIADHAGGSMFSKYIYHQKFAGVYLQMDSLQQARREYTLSLQMAEGDKHVIADALIALAGIHQREGNYRQAYRSLKEGKELYDSIFTAEKSKTIEELNIKYETRQQQLALSNANQQLQVEHQEKALRQAEYSRQKSRLILLIIVTLSSAAILALYYNRMKLKNKAAGQQAILQERLRISRELHDEVGATLSGIVMYSHLTKDQINKRDIPAVERSLNIMQVSSEEMVSKLNEIVWLINPGKDTLQRLVQKLEEYARNMAATRGMLVQTAVPETIAGLSLSFERRRNIYLLCKEAINNAVKYSKGSLLSLSIDHRSGKLAITISDNGQGFDVLQAHSGNGLANMRRRAEEMGAKFMIRSGENEGSTVSVEIIEP